MRWGLHLTKRAVKELYALDRMLVPNVWKVLRTLIEDPNAANLQTDEDDPSLYWLAVEGDVAIFFEIIDEDKTVIVIRIE